jgi:hypothetical protein
MVGYAPLISYKLIESNQSLYKTLNFIY